ETVVKANTDLRLLTFDFFLQRSTDGFRQSSLRPTARADSLDERRHAPGHGPAARDRRRQPGIPVSISGGRRQRISTRRPRLYTERADGNRNGVRQGGPRQESGRWQPDPHSADTKINTLLRWPTATPCRPISISTWMTRSALIARSPAASRSICAVGTPS